MTIRRHHSQFLLSLFLLLSLVTPAPAWSWNAAGHRLIAAIAWDHLNAQARTETLRLLRMHPDHGRWMLHGGSEQGEPTAFFEASTWPDDIRHDARFYDAESEQATPFRPAFRTCDGIGAGIMSIFPLKPRLGNRRFPANWTGSSSS